MTKGAPNGAPFGQCLYVRILDRQLDEEGVVAGTALCPNFSLVCGDDGFGDGKPQTVAAIHCPGLICPVKPLEYILEVFFGQGFTGTGNG